MSITRYLKSHRYYLGATIILSSLVVALGYVVTGPTGPDDIFITYWPVETLASKGEILNYNLDRVEQSSSLLQVISMSSLVYFFPESTILIGHLYSILGCILSIYIVFLLAHKMKVNWVYVPSLLTVTLPFFVHWSFSGSDITISTFLITWWVLVAASYIENPSSRCDFYSFFSLFAVTLLLALSRPEMPIVILCVVTGIAGIQLIRKVFGNRDTRLIKLVGLGASTFTAIAALFSFRYVYFGMIFPQPVYAKNTSLSLLSIREGVGYFLGYNVFSEINLLGFTPFSLLSLFFASSFVFTAYYLISSENKNTYVAITLLVLFTYWSFFVLTGRDWMPAYRFWVPTIPLSFCILMLFLEGLIHPKGRRYALSFVFLIMSACWVNYVADSGKKGVSLWNRNQYSNVNNHVKDYVWFIKYNRFLPQQVAEFNTIEEAFSLIEGRLASLHDEAGLEMYLTAKKFGSKVSMYDTRGLTHRELNSCDHRELDGSVYGYNFLPSDVAGSHIGVLEECFPSIDALVLYRSIELDDASKRYFRREGYTCSVENEEAVNRLLVNINSLNEKSKPHVCTAL